MDWVKTINAAITYMEEHLTEEIRLNDIARFCPKKVCTDAGGE